jgi:hypothetical protein
LTTGSILPIRRIQRRLFKSNLNPFHNIRFWIDPHINLARTWLHRTFLRSGQMRKLHIASTRKLRRLAVLNHIRLAQGFQQLIN